MLEELLLRNLPVVHVCHARLLPPGLQDGGFAFLVARSVVGAVAHDVLVQVLAQVPEEHIRVAASQSLRVAEGQVPEGDAGALRQGGLWVVVEEAEAHLLVRGLAEHRAGGAGGGSEVAPGVQLVARKHLDGRVVAVEQPKGNDDY